MIRQNMRFRRRGAIAVFAAFLVVILVGMVAFAVDTGYVVLTRTELQSAADAAALAGADPLMNASVQYQMAGQNPQNAKNGYQGTILGNAMASARTQAKQFAANNSAGGVSSLTLNDSDIEFGFTDASYNYTAYNSKSPVFPNTIKVTLRRDSTANGALGLFFAPVIGTSTVNVTATASATIMGGTVNNFKSVNNQNTGMLPMTYDINAWNNFLNTGQWPDGTTTADSNGVPQLQLYPSVKDTGNFGQLSLDDSQVGQSTEASWITNGLSSSDLAALQSAGLLPLSGHNPNSWDWMGATGLKTSLAADVNGYAGKTFVLPLFTPYNSSSSNYQAGTGQGSNYYYNVVQFVGITIMPGAGNHQILVEPAAITNPSFVLAGTPAPAGTTSTPMTTFTYPRLTN
jgi:Flp pilus assembly protein TadG